jgi:hypothetical protein
MMKNIGLSVKPVQTAIGRSDPDIAGSILFNILDIAAGYGCSILNVIPENFEFVPVIPVQAILGAYPDESLAILHNA